MKRKQKQNKSKTTRTYKPKAKKYPTHYLAIVLTAVLLLEGITISASNSTSWRDGAGILDVSSAVSETTSDVAAVFSPVLNLVYGITEFYSQAANQMAFMLDFSGKFEGVTFAYDGISGFYAEASREMASILDISDYVNPTGQVSGIWIEN